MSASMYLIKDNGVNYIYTKTFLGMIMLGSDNTLINKKEKLTILLKTENCNEILSTADDDFCIVQYNYEKDENGYSLLNKI